MALENRQLETFVHDALKHGQSRGAITAALAAAGWPEGQIKSALRAFAELDFPLPVPRPRPSLDARDAFLYLLMFSALYCAAWNLGEILFDFVDRAFPDPLDNRYDFWSTHSWSTAAIIIAVPVFLTLASVINRHTQIDPLKRLSPVRRWLTYMTLFIAGIVLMTDATSLIHNFLIGEWTARFALKVLITAAIAGTIFAYYLGDLRREERQ